VLRPRPLVLLLALPVLLLASACGGGGGGDSAAGGGGSGPTLTIGAIPDQDPEQLQRLYGTVADELGRLLGVPVAYRPVTDYAAAVSAFRTGDLDLVWFGGLTGVQARLQVDGARAIAQRDIDAEFHSVFIVNTATGIEPFDGVTGLGALAGRRFTFGSESSTSGRLMPQYFLGQAGVEPASFAGPPGFSGSHDKTIELVTSGTFEAGVLNEQVWASRLASGDVDTARVRAVFRTPAYHDYHWVIRPDVEERFGVGFTDRVTEALLSLSPDDPAQAQVLELFGAGRFVATEAANYAQIEEVGREVGLIR